MGFLLSAGAWCMYIVGYTTGQCTSVEVDRNWEMTLFKQLQWWDFPMFLTVLLNLCLPFQSAEQSIPPKKNKIRSTGPERRECKTMSCSFQLCITAIVLRRALSPGTYEVTAPGGSKNFISLFIRHSQIMLLYPTNYQLSGVLQTQRQKKLERFSKWSSFKATTDHHL